LLYAVASPLFRFLQPPLADGAATTVFAAGSDNVSSPPLDAS